MFISDTAEWKALEKHIGAIEKTHLRELLKDDVRFKKCVLEHNGIYVDFARQRVTEETLDLLEELANKVGLKEKIAAMFSGEHLNVTEDRAVMHAALRAPATEKIMVDGKDVVPDVHDVLEKIKVFSEMVRNGEWLGATGKPLIDVVAIGIGGSFLGPLFVHTALMTNADSQDSSRGRQLNFLKCGPHRCGPLAERAGPRDHARGGGVQDLHHRRDYAQRAHRAQVDHLGPG